MGMGNPMDMQFLQCPGFSQGGMGKPMGMEILMGMGIPRGYGKTHGYGKSRGYCLVGLGQAVAQQALCSRY
jgi:hypothetical protein